MRAFEARAVDYLLKPPNARRFQEALEKVRRTLGRGDDGDRTLHAVERLEPRDRVPSAAPGASYYRRFTVREANHFIVVKAQDVDWFEAASNCVQLHVHGREYLPRVTLSELEENLDPSQFTRIHRSTIVNVDRIAEIRPTWRGGFIVLLAGGTSLRLSRFYRERLISSKWQQEQAPARRDRVEASAAPE